MSLQAWNDVQNPPPGQFSSDSLTWSPRDKSIIPWVRLLDFKDGEGRKHQDYEASFFIRSSKKAKSPIVHWTEYRTYWCSYGPEEQETCLPTVPPLNGEKPKEGPGSRPKLRKQQFNNHSKRGCQCHFIAKRLRANPDTVEIVYKQRKHLNSRGEQVHGAWDVTQGPALWGLKCSIAPWLTNEIRRNLEDLIRAGWSVPDIYDLHCQSQFEREGLDRGLDFTNIDSGLVSFDGRDDLVSKQDLYNMKRKIDKESYLWDNNDQSSIGKWISLYPERVLFHHEYIEGPADGDPVQPLLLALQSPWQRAQMVLLSHDSILTLDSTFATNKYGFPFFTLVVFDRHQMGLPVAWCIQQTESAEQIVLFLKSVKEKALLIKADWKPSCFVIDCAEAEVKALKEVFQDVPIYFCSWHVRRAWKDNLIKKVPIRSKLLEMNDELGDIMYADSDTHMHTCTWRNFCTKHHTEKAFIDYFRDTWMNRTAKWMRAVRDMPRANQNTNGAIEAWHLTFKKMIKRKIGDIGARRLDKIVQSLFQVMVPFFWYQLRCKARGRVINYKEEVVLSSLHKAEHHMTDQQVAFYISDQPNKAFVRSMNVPVKQYEVRNIYSNFPTCSCKWAKEGNMCKHQLKALLVRGHHGGVLVQQLGACFGSEMGGISHLAEPTIYHDSNPLDEGDLDDGQGDLDDGQGDLVDGQGEFDDGQGDLDNGQGKANTEQKFRASLMKTVEEILAVVQGDTEMTKMAFLSFQVTLNKIKDKQILMALTGKGRSDAADAFVRPVRLTAKRHLGVVDIYHSGQRGKRVATGSIISSGRSDCSPWAKDDTPSGQADNLGTKAYSLCSGQTDNPRNKGYSLCSGQTDNPGNKGDSLCSGIIDRPGAQGSGSGSTSGIQQPSKLPPKATVARESFREHLSRLGEEYVAGKRGRGRRIASSCRKSKTMTNRQVDLGGASREIDMNVSFDLNEA